MKMKHIFITILTLSIVLAGCTNERGLNKEHNEKQSPKGDKQELQVSAAASLTEVSKSLENEFKKDHPNVEIKFNYGGSGALRQQIEAGAPADVMMSANTKDIDLLKKKNKAHDTYNYAKNQLVLIGDKNKSYTSVKDLNQNDKLALGQIKTVPAGKYAKQY
ncbi:molybdenum ABC transporter substrate-binding protein, partial [Staphylococcus epidermidis Scl22]